ncbi:MAG TPA: hypothetical protein VLF71_04085 [Candidatus Saccharimonadales bacterium]|nr:hypothetical protein [Candidatus Saccharimonadales bacterium]
MKTNKKQNKHERPLHLHLEYFFRKRYCLLAVMALMAAAVLKSDMRLMGIVRQAYADGFGLVGQYMREETTRVPVTFDIAGRLPTVSGR